MGNWQGKEERANFIFRVDKELQKKFKSVCVKNNVIMSDIVNEFIERYVNHFEKKKV